MATNTIKIKAKVKDSIADVRCIITHPMETGFRKDQKTGEVVPAHFIQEVTVAINDLVVLTGDWGGAVSKNPYFGIRIKNAKVGDQVRVSWTDNKGDKDSAAVAVAEGKK